LKIGLATKGASDPRLLEKMAVRADELGYDSFLVTDHFMTQVSNRNIDAWTFLPYLAGKTKKIRLGTCVTPLPFRHPAMLAKMVATADFLSGGRIILGSGLGWSRPEFEGFSTWRELPDRAAMSREALELMTRLWTSESPVDYQGRFVGVRGAVVEPKPVQKPYPSVWFGAMAPFHLRLAAAYGSGWIPVGPRWTVAEMISPQRYAEMKAVIDAELSRRGRPADDFVYSILIGHADIATLRSEVEKYIEEGMNYFIIGQPRGADETFLRDMEVVAKDLAPSL
jgi:alkanesulfonate monooxygenase SsuD/methylene tetrahydromethanopterin reductase-like flavin-dependent oxidoreductase (luciferase family)